MKGVLFAFMALVLFAACTSQPAPKETSTPQPMPSSVGSIEPVNMKATLTGFDPNLGECVVPVVNLWDERFKKVLYRVRVGEEGGTFPEFCQIEATVLKKGVINGRIAYLVEVETTNGKVKGWVLDSLVKF